MRRILLACAASLVLYGIAFGCLLDRPLTLGRLRAQINANLALGTAITGPKLVILAGSNGPYSHRCEMIGPIVGRPCINAGVAVGVGLDYLFARWKPLLRPGDVVYLPLEETQYARERTTSELGPDAAIMLRHDRATLWTMPPHRQLAALFASDLRAGIMSLLEMALLDSDFHDPRAAATGSTNAWGDHIGHTIALSAASRSALLHEQPFHATAAQISGGYGTELVRQFVRWAAARDIRVIGGLPTGFADSPIGTDSLAAIRAVYLGAGFLELPNRSRYPRSDFFDSPDHLNEAAQIRHSFAIAQALRCMMGGTVSRGADPPVRLVATHAPATPQ
ncbi:hypothetical protein [Rhodopila sp.]|uniref:hypothetical protein n=1 Tax=Rhodopila sp. TaxID=2480087 RepID=UPI003D0FBB6D